MAQHGFSHFGAAPNGGGIDPNNLSMAGSYNPNFGNDNFSSHANNNGGNNNSSAFLADEDLLDGLGGDQGAAQNNGQEFPGMNMGFSQDAYQAHHRNSSLRLDASHPNGFSSTPDGDPMPSPYTTGYTGNFRQMQGIHSPMFTNDVDGTDQNYMNARARARMSQQMQRKPSNTARSPMTPKTNAMHSLSLGSNDSPNFGPQSIHTHDKSPTGQWLNTPTGSYPASYNSGFASPLQGTMVPPIEEVMGKGGASMPAKLGGTNGPGSAAVSSQEAKRKRRRESHNLVERRRRDNINERIQDLSKLVPMHRLEDEKVRKLIQNGTPLSPTLTGMSNPSSATSGLAGPGARRATGSNAGNITTGLPIEDKDKGPNKGDILNGAVSWTRDLMWMLHLKLQQQEELMQTLNELGHPYPFELTDDERRMQSELIEAMSKNDAGNFSYTRTAGSGLRVPNITDYRGNAANADVPPTSLDTVGITPPHQSGSAIIDDDTNQFWHDPDDNGTGHAPIDFKDDDDYGMDLN